MGFRYDMRGKSTQQQAIVRQRDENDRIRKQESEKREREEQRAKLSPETYKQMCDLLEQYTIEIMESKLEESTKKTYLRHANTFVRWCNGDFSPGQNK